MISELLGIRDVHSVQDRLPEQKMRQDFAYGRNLFEAILHKNFFNFLRRCFDGIRLYLLWRCSYQCVCKKEVASR